MELYSEYSTESLYNGGNGEYWKKQPSIMKKNKIKSKNNFSLGIRNVFLFRLPTKEIGGEKNICLIKRKIKRNNDLLKKIKKTVFKEWVKKTRHISFSENNIQNYTVYKKMKKYKRKSNNIKKYIYNI